MPLCLLRSAKRVFQHYRPQPVVRFSLSSARRSVRACVQHGHRGEPRVDQHRLNEPSAWDRDANRRASVAPPCSDLANTILVRNSPAPRCRFDAINLRPCVDRAIESDSRRQVSMAHESPLRSALQFERDTLCRERQSDALLRAVQAKHDTIFIFHDHIARATG